MSTGFLFIRSTLTKKYQKSMDFRLQDRRIACIIKFVKLYNPEENFPRQEDAEQKC